MINFAFDDIRRINEKLTGLMYYMVKWNHVALYLRWSKCT